MLNRSIFIRAPFNERHFMMNVELCVGVSELVQAEERCEKSSAINDLILCSSFLAGFACLRHTQPHQRLNAL